MSASPTGTLASAASTVGTPESTVALWVSTSFQKLAITALLRNSAWVGITVSAPALSEVSEPGKTPATWNRG